MFVGSIPWSLWKCIVHILQAALVRGSNQGREKDISKPEFLHRVGVAGSHVAQVLLVIPHAGEYDMDVPSTSTFSNLCKMSVWQGADMYIGGQGMRSPLVGCKLLICQGKNNVDIGMYAS